MGRGPDSILGLLSGFYGIFALCSACALAIFTLIAHDRGGSRYFGVLEFV